MIKTRPTEFDLIARYFAPLSASNAFGLLDDAAVIAPPLGHDLVITKDMLVSDRHFFDKDPPEAIAAKALRVNLSDLAAKGARPLGFLLGMALPENWQPVWLERFAEGLARDITFYDCPLYGGDTVQASGGLTISITAFGTVPSGQMVRRTTLQEGDSLYVSGAIGDSALGLKMRMYSSTAYGKSNFTKYQKKDDFDYLLNRYLLPQPRLELRNAILEFASASMDISDGFIGDLAKMLEKRNLALSFPVSRIPMSDAAKNAILIEPELLETVLTGGDDYELLIAVPTSNKLEFEQAAKETGIAVTYLGVATKAQSARLEIFDGNGLPLRFASTSFSHF